jgi:hypothetical protein
VIRFTDEHSGRSDALGTADAVRAMTDAVTRLLEGGHAGRRFPLLRLVGRARPLSRDECDALAREVERLRRHLAAFPVDELRPASTTSDPALDGAAPLGPAPEPFPRPDGAPAPRTLAEAFARPLAALEVVARLGAASHRGARFEALAPGALPVAAAARRAAAPPPPAPQPSPSAQPAT